MVAYTVVLAAVTIALGPVADLGILYLVASIVLNLAFIGGTVGLARQPSPARSMRLFAYSISYVTLLFVAMAVDVFIEHGF